MGAILVRVVLPLMALPGAGRSPTEREGLSTGMHLSLERRVGRIERMGVRQNRS
jgi:hypothetical protein